MRPRPKPCLARDSVPEDWDNDAMNALGEIEISAEENAHLSAKLEPERIADGEPGSTHGQSSEALTVTVCVTVGRRSPRLSFTPHACTPPASTYAAVWRLAVPKLLWGPLNPG
jgi:hypothetical protein